jgi:hypothetical protein
MKTLYIPYQLTREAREAREAVAKSQFPDLEDGSQEESKEDSKEESNEEPASESN